MLSPFDYPLGNSQIFKTAVPFPTYIDLLPTLKHTNIGRLGGWIPTRTVPGGIWTTLLPEELDDIVTLLRYKQRLLNES